MYFTSYWKSDDFVVFPIRSEKLQNHNKEMGYTRTHGRTHAGRTNTIFLVNGFKNPALRAGQNKKGETKEDFYRRGNLFFSNRTVLYLPSRLRFSVCSLFFFKEPTFPERAPGGSHPSGGPHLAGPASFFKKNITQNALSFGIEGLT